MNSTAIFWAAAALFMAVPTLLDLLIKSESNRSRVNLLLGLSVLIWGSYTVYEYWPLQKHCIGDAHMGWYHDHTTTLLTPEGWINVKSYYPIYRGQMLYLAHDRHGEQLLCRDVDGGCVDVLSLTSEFHPSIPFQSMELRSMDTSFNSPWPHWKSTTIAVLGLLLIGSISLNVQLLWGSSSDKDEVNG